MRSIILAGVMMLAAASVPAAPAPGAAERLRAADLAAYPGNGDIQRCLPGGTDLRHGRALLACRVGPKGELADCQVSGVGDERWKAAALCLVPTFRTRPGQAGQWVAVPVVFEFPR